MAQVESESKSKWSGLRVGLGLLRDGEKGDIRSFSAHIHPD